jgi:hypothetical protein
LAIAVVADAGCGLSDDLSLFPYSFGYLEKHSVKAENSGKHSEPFALASLLWKHVKARRKVNPHGPEAIPPRHGQSQLIEPFGKIKPLK